MHGPLNVKFGRLTLWRLKINLPCIKDAVRTLLTTHVSSMNSQKTDKELQGITNPSTKYTQKAYLNSPIITCPNLWSKMNQVLNCYCISITSWNCLYYFPFGNQSKTLRTFPSKLSTFNIGRWSVYTHICCSHATRSVKDFNNWAVGCTTLAASLGSINICRFVVPYSYTKRCNLKSATSKSVKRSHCATYWNEG
jgi:hypothetical protein